MSRAADPVTDSAPVRSAATPVPGGAAPAAAPPGRAAGPGAPARPDEQTLHEQLAQVRRERDEHLDTLQRVQAEYDNYRRRSRREHAEQHDRGGQALAVELLPVLDAFDAARVHAPEALEPLRGALHDALRAAGLERLEPVGEPFDPAEQYAVEHLPRQDEAPPARDGGEQAPRSSSGVVEEVLRPGYRWRGRLLRPAMVRVRSA